MKAKRGGLSGWGMAAVLGGALAAGMAAGCASAPKARFTDADWVSHSTTGRGAYERGDYRRAAEAYGRAEQRARALDDAEALAVSAMNRAASLWGLERAEEARAGILAAMEDARISAGRRAELTVALARAHWMAGDAEGAIEVAGAALKEKLSAAERSKAELALAGAQFSLGRAEAAGAVLRRERESVWRGQSAVMRAERAELLGRVESAAGRAGESAELWDEAAALWREAGRLPEMARALASGAQSAETAGDALGAGDRYVRASRSLWELGYPAEAAGLLEMAAGCAESAGDESLGRQVARLVVTFGKGVRLHEKGTEEP